MMDNGVIDNGQMGRGGTSIAGGGYRNGDGVEDKGRDTGSPCEMRFA